MEGDTHILLNIRTLFHEILYVTKTPSHETKVNNIRFADRIYDAMQVVNIKLTADHPWLRL